LIYQKLEPTEKTADEVKGKFAESGSQEFQKFKHRKMSIPYLEKIFSMGLNMSAPAVKDLPTIDNGIKEQLEKDHQLKKTSVTEKQVLPSADDIKAEKTHQGIMQGVETFSADNLKETKTREPASGVDLMKTEMAIRSSLQGVENFDAAKLKNVEVQEKNPLPDKEAISMEKEHQKFKDGVEGFKRESLNPATTVEKNTLPTKEVIEAEKKAE